MSDRLPRTGWVPLTVLVACQLLAGVGVASGIAVGGLLAAEVTGATALAGLAQTASVLGAGVVAIPMARLATRKGRRFSLATGYLLALLGAVAVIIAAVTAVTPLLFAGMAAFGAASAAGLQARFAATEIAAPGYEARSMSVVLWATTLGAVVGPNLSQLGDDLGRALGLPALVGPFLFSATAFAATTLLTALLLRTPPAGVLESDAGAEAASAAPAVGTVAALRTAMRIPMALLGITAVVVSQTVMVAVMVMTPVNLHVHGIGLGLIGLVLSIHVFGMYAASPVMGWLADRIGGARLVVVAIVILFAATTLGMTFPGDDMVVVPLALGLLGLGWSAGLIGGSALLTASVDRAVRVPLQGATDAAMNIAAATASAFSGIILGLGGFGAVNLFAALVLLVLVGVGARTLAIHRKAAPRPE